MAKEKNKLNISIALALILILFMASGIILSLKTLFNAREDISDVKKELIFAEVNINNIKNLEDLLASLKEENKKISSVFLAKYEIVDFIEALEKLAGVSGVELEIKSVKFADGIDDGGKEKPALLLAVSGPFQNIIHFISFIEKMPYQISFDQMTVQKSGSKENEESLWKSEVSIIILSYQL